jgi:cell division protein FtsB
MGGVTVPPRPGVPRREPPRPECSEAEPKPSRVPGQGASGQRARMGSGGRTTASWRVVVLILVLVLALAVILPSLRAYSRQNQRLAELRAEAEEARQEVADLEAELARWDDPAYIVAQARERLRYVLPGETPYRVVDPETVTGTQPTTPDTDPIPIRDGVPWYLNLWDSLENPGDDNPGGP